MNKTISLMIIGAISLLMAAVFAGQIASEGNKVTDLTTVHNEAIAVGAATLGENATKESQTFTVANLGDTSTDCPLTSVSLTNYSGTALTETTNWVMNKDTGVFYLKNSSAVWAGFKNVNTTKVTYTYCPDGYMNLSWGRTSIDTTMGLYAIGALLVAVGMFYAAARESGIVGK